MPYGQVNADLMVDSSGGRFSPISSVFRNRIINGNMVIDQRNAGASVTPTATGYGLDRWVYAVSQSSKFSFQQNAGSVTPPAGYINYLGATSLSAYSITSTDFFLIRQAIEGLNIADLGWGTANAKTVTLSAWVYSSLTGTFGGYLSNSAENRSYPFTYTISVANTWTQISVTIAGDTSGTWLTTNGVGIRAAFSLGVGTTYSGTAGAWAGSLYLSATGATSVVGTSGATFYITGVQLEVGSSATGFEYVDYGTQLAMCQRYLPAFRYNGAAGIIPVLTQFNSTTTSRGYITFPVPTRANVTGATVSSASHFVLQFYAGGSGTPNTISLHQGGTSGAGIDVNFASGASTDKSTGVLQIDNSAGYIYFNGAEL